MVGSRVNKRYSPSPLRQQRDDFRAQRGTIHGEPRQRNWQVKAAGPGAAGIAVEHTLADLMACAVGMSADDGVVPTRARVEVQLGEVVPNVNSGASGIDR